MKWSLTTCVDLETIYNTFKGFKFRGHDVFDNDFCKSFHKKPPNLKATDLMNAMTMDILYGNGLLIQICGIEKLYKHYQPWKRQTNESCHRAAMIVYNCANCHHSVF